MKSHKNSIKLKMSEERIELSSFFDLKNSRTILINNNNLFNKNNKYPSNKICNQKFTFLTFLPKVFYEQFKFFFNLYFLLVSLRFLLFIKVS